MNEASHTTTTKKQSLRDAVQQFGFPIERFVPGRRAARALRIAGLVDVLLGVGVALWSHLTDRHWALLVAGMGLVISGIVVVVLSRRFGDGGVLICPRGLIVASQGQIQTLPWDQMRSITQATDSGFSIERKDGTSFTIEAGAVGDVARFAEVLKAESSGRKVAWKNPA